VVVFFAAGASASLGLDVAVPVTASQLQCIKQTMDYIIVRCFRSTGTPDQNCPATMQAAQAAGLSTDIYFFPKFGVDPAAQVSTAASFFSSKGVTFGMIWFDVEQPPNWGTCAANQVFLTGLVNAAQGRGWKVGLYASSFFWTSMMCGVTTFSALPLWYPHYDQVPSFSDFKPFGGWTKPAIKQYSSTTPCCGVNCDRNFRTAGPPPPPPPSTVTSTGTSSGNSTVTSTGPDTSTSGPPTSSEASSAVSAGRGGLEDVATDPELGGGRAAERAHEEYAKKLRSQKKRSRRTAH